MTTVSVGGLYRAQVPTERRTAAGGRADDVVLSHGTRGRPGEAHGDADTGDRALRQP